MQVLWDINGRLKSVRSVGDIISSIKLVYVMYKYSGCKLEILCIMA